MFALVELGMCFVIMTGGIDLSVGSVAAMSSVVSAYLSPYGLVAGLGGGLLAGAVAGSLNGFLITKLKIFPFIATLAVMLAASGTVSCSPTTSRFPCPMTRRSSPLGRATCSRPSSPIGSTATTPAGLAAH